MVGPEIKVAVIALFSFASGLLLQLGAAVNRFFARTASGQETEGGALERAKLHYSASRILFFFIIYLRDICCMGFWGFGVLGF